VLVRRFKETRRRHPLCDEGGSVSTVSRRAGGSQTSAGERTSSSTRARSSPPAAACAIRDRFFVGHLASSLAVTVVSFGFKYGLPTDADIVMDVRFLPNPYYHPALGRSPDSTSRSASSCSSGPRDREFLEKWFDLLGDARAQLPHAEGKTHLSIALGCTGGMHRSVALAEETAASCAQRVTGWR
jgi:RNase adapter protein RapZ